MSHRLRRVRGGYPKRVMRRALTASGIALLAASCVLLLNPEAPAAKKCKNHKRCNDSKLFAKIAGHSLRLTTTDSPPGTERYDFCRGGGYSYRAAGGAGDQPYEVRYHGRWRVVSSQGSSGVIQYTVKGFSTTPPGGGDAPPSPIAKPVTFGPFGVYFGGALYTRGKARCG